MTPAEQVTAFSPKNKTYDDLCCALTAYLKTKGIEAEEYGPSPMCFAEREAMIPSRYRWLIAYAVEGSCEGYYVHIAALVDNPTGRTEITIALAKMYTAELAYRMAIESQRFLTATAWN